MTRTTGESLGTSPGTPDPGPLAGLRVLELGTLIAGPFAGRLFADFGADVLKIEQPPDGDPHRAWGMSVEGAGSLWSLVQNRGKRSLALDLHDPASRAIVRELTREADILIENFRPGRLEAWGLDPAELQRENPRLVIVRISGFGQTGPLRDQPGFGTIAEAAGGLRYVTGEPDRPPTRVGLSLGDSIAALYGVIGALVAIRERDRSGAGQVVDVALSEAVFSLLEGILPEYSLFGRIRERTGNIAHNSAPTNAYRCSDGEYVVIGANSDGLFAALMGLIERPDLAMSAELGTNRGRVRHANELDAAIGAWTVIRTRDEVVAAVRAARIPCSRIASVADIVTDPQFQARDMLVEVVDPRLRKPILTPGIVPRLSRTPGRVRGLGPRVGADPSPRWRDLAGSIHDTEATDA
ncbi:MAG: CaiB/BaiF CoA transferase family protein [Candidatus Limnocylindrales bacterium]